MNIVGGVYYYLHSIIEIWYGSFRSTSAEDSMTDYENRPSASEISQAHESDQTPHERYTGTASRSLHMKRINRQLLEK